MRCSNCKTENPPGKKFCGDCGALLANVCPKCGADNPADKHFCGDCGTALASSAPASPKNSPIRIADTPAPEDLEGERKTVTALFADIKGSTELEQDLDPEEARAIVDPALKLMIDAVRRYDGYVVQSTGDGIFALFGAPVAHEDHPQRALYAALRMQEDLRHYASRLREDGKAPIAVRVGVNTGEVVVRSIRTGDAHAEYTPIGHTTNLASRMQTLAMPGSVVVSENTRKLAEGYFQLKPLGPSRVKGVVEPVQVYEVLGLGPLRTRLQRSAGRGLSKFVGREREMDALKQAGAQARSGRGQIVAAMAEAGVGKSRLFYEFKAVAQSGFMVLETFSVSHGKATAFVPVIELLWNYFRIDANDDARLRREKVTGRVLALDRTLEDTLPFLFALLGLTGTDDPLARMDDQTKQRKMLEAIKRLIVRESLNQPLMLIVEDLHWVDEESQGLLNLLADSIGTSKILMLVNYRPEYSHHWSNKTYYAQLRLDPLGKQSAGEMLSALLGDDEHLAPLKRLIVERTEGNPFFMEETVQVLLDDGALVRDGASLRLTRPLADLKIPPTVQAILAARIDRLPPDEKELLHTLAIMGKEFRLGLVREVLHPDAAGAALAEAADELNRMLNELQLAEFIYEQPSSGDVEYTFKHALTQEVAYNSVLSERRKLIHERIAQAIERVYAERLDDHLAELAHHYRRSGNAAKAIDYLVRAAEQSVARGARSEAEAGLDTAIELLDALPEGAERKRREAAIQIAVSLTFPSPAESGVEKACLRARELSVESGDRALQFRALAGLRTYYTFRAELKRASDVGHELLAEAKRAGNPGLLVSALTGVGQNYYLRGKGIEALEHYGQAAELARVARKSSILAFPVPEWDLRPPLIKWILGYPDQARRMRQNSLEILRTETDLLTRVLSSIFFGQLSQALREWKEAAQYAATAERLGIEYGTLQALGFARAIRGWATAQSGDPAQGIADVRRGMDDLARGGTKLRGFVHATMMECQLRLDQIDQGLETVVAALYEIQQSDERVMVAELHRLKGELLVRRGAAEDADAAFREAIEIAQSQQAKSWELRATTSRARMLRDTGRRDEARAILANIYNWFTEGFDTADLKDAKGLLDELTI